MNTSCFQLQNEKRKMLMEHETSKLKELDESYAKEFKEWKADLKPRKQVGRRSPELLICPLTAPLPSLPVLMSVLSSLCTGNCVRAVTSGHSTR